MNKEIICLNENCKFNEYGHCMYQKGYLMITQDGLCKDFEQKEHWKEGIQETVAEEVMTKSDLKDIEENKAKYSNTQKEEVNKDDYMSSL